MTASDDSRGLKVAVAAFLSLSVILAVTCYFLYSNYAMAQAKLSAANDVKRQLERIQAVHLNQIEDLKRKLEIRDSVGEAPRKGVERSAVELAVEDEGPVMRPASPGPLESVAEVAAQSSASGNENPAGASKLMKAPSGDRIGTDPSRRDRRPRPDALNARTRLPAPV